jgi:hypothetical protein
MLRKLISTLALVAIFVVGLGSVSPSQAAPISSDISDLPSGAQIITLIPLDDEKTLAIWRNDDGIQSSQFHANGTFDNTAMISPNVSGRYESFADSNSWVKMPDGTIAITWTSVWISNDASYSEISVAFTDDATQWSTPINPAPTSYANRYDCMGMMYECGYSGSQIASSILSTIAIQYEVSTSDTDKRLLTQISNDGATWSSQTKIAGNYSYSFARSITGLDGGGFISTWALNDGFRYFSRTNGTLLSTWTRAAELSNDSNLNYEPAFKKTAPGEYTAFYLTVSDGVKIVKSRTYSTVSKTWGAPRVVLQINANGWALGSIQVSEPRNGKFAVSLGFALDGQLHSDLYVNLFAPTVLGTQFILTTLASQSTYFSPVTLNHDGSMTAVTAPLNGVVTIETYLQGVSVDSHVIPYPEAQTVGLATSVSANGNVFVVAQRSPAKGFTYQRATSPIPSGTARVTGTPKLGAKLTAAAMTFGGFSGVGATKYQWYSCTRAVAANTVSLPVGCSPIAKATASTFKVTTKQKGKFITVAVKNSNGVGTTTLFAPVATKSK